MGSTIVVKKLTLLIVEDEALIALGLKKKLEGIGLEILDIASNADKALKIVDSYDLDLILMDINLSGQRNGIDIAVEVSKHTDIKIIFMTGYHSNDDYRKRAMKLNPLAYLSKPVNFTELQNILQ